MTTTGGEIMRRCAQLEAALRQIEWGGSRYYGFETCPECAREREEGHTKDCLVGAALNPKDDGLDS